MSPTALSLKLLRKEGWTCEVVERWIPHTMIRRDLFSFGDILAIHPKGKRFLIVQVTVVSHAAGRLAKIRSLATAALWLRTGGHIELHAWRMRKPPAVKRIAVRPESMGDMFLAVPKRRRKQPDMEAVDLFALSR